MKLDGNKSFKRKLLIIGGLLVVVVFYNLIFSKLLESDDKEQDESFEEPTNQKKNEKANNLLPKTFQIPDSESFVNRFAKDPSKFKKVENEETEITEKSEADNNLEGFEIYCQKKSEWENYNLAAFIRRSAIFYFVDLRLLRIHAILRPNQAYKFYIKVDVLSNKETVESKVIPEANIKSNWIVEENNFVVLDAKLDLEGNYESSKIKLNVTIKEVNIGKEAYFDAKIKSFHCESVDKKGAILCTKCLHLSDNYTTLRWWLEVNKQVGYDKI
jgi:hypothetical protein